MKKAIILLAIISSIALSFGIVNFSNIIVLKDHHVEKYDKYTYAYDCMKEAEVTYWDYKVALINEVQNYITQIAPTSNLRGYALVEECEKYNIDICFVLAQGEIESHFGTKGIASKLNSVFNVGIYDGKTTEEIDNKYKFDYPNESIEPYLKLLIDRYLINKTEEDLMKKFVDKDGKRYASNPNYEIMVSERYKFITENTKIIELYNQVKNFAIKCGR